MKKNMLGFTKKMAAGAAVIFFANFASAQTLQDGVVSIDSHKFANARQVFTSMIAKAPTDASNYFYLGDTYLTQFEPNFEKAEEYFKKGLSIDGKSALNKVGLATIKLGRGDKNAIAEIKKIAADTRGKEPEVLYKAAEALTMFTNNDPDSAISLLNLAIDKSQKSGVPARYYYTLGDAYRLKKLPGDAMTAYDKASVVSKNKASVFTRMGTLWMAAEQYKLAKENIDKAIAIDPTYAPAYKAMANYNYKFRETDKMTQSLINYTKYADEDPYTLLEISKLYFTNEDFANSKATLDKVFDKVDDPIKYKLRAYLDYHADKNYASAKDNLAKFMTSVKDQTRIQPADKGLEGLIIAGLAQSEKDPAKKTAMMAEANQKVAIAKNAKDETLDWDKELATLQSSTDLVAAANQGPTSPKIEALKKKVAANANDTNSLVELGNAYQEVQNWNGALGAWQKMASAIPTWEYSYYGQGVAYQQLGKDTQAQQSYQKYIDTLLTKPAAEQEQSKVTLSYAYYLVAYYAQKTDLAKAKDYVAKAVQLNPSYKDAVELNKTLNK